ncbi:RagB/SusD family nutrient uptake outer membrane protein [Mucilaginibacter sp. Bleaf8]|uniref:RagB/SusD family nutrient uptake outer membrane protein n=1 Tax=Mucilaginibacter sp. Bleaf8 TaxID=2834430 RepID=UPI001BCBE2B0|nr:RagB/SusD family nutrient uptake outer membrane protein [Mucilaginibacter sp. Bleaf8]MBS7563749.1 RagB/SusD family nutrient uptake outer membrane protein [Mucilaginibacter sp. Bleaf8]
MKKNIVRFLSLTALCTIGLTSCKKDLDRMPTNATTNEAVFSTPVGYKQALAKVYGAFALTGSTGSGSSDLGNIDAGTSDFVRLFWSAQEWTTEEALCAWNNTDVPDFHNLSWSSNNTLLNGLYNRCVYQITVANAFIKESTDEKLSSRGITGTDAENIRHYRAEARFLRAYQYWVLMDLFGNPPFIDENSPIGDKSFFPARITRDKLFAYIESELKALETQLVAPRQNEYGRADQAAAWALLARMYLNAEVYLGSGNAKYTDAITYANKVIGAGYTLQSSYQKLFLADNNVGNTETILSVNYDGVNTQNYGGTTFIINASVNSDMGPANYGIPNGGWGGNRSTRNLPLLFSDRSGNTDKRAIFYGSNLEISNVNDFTQGVAVVKFKNLLSDGKAAPSSGGTFCSTDFPLFRLGEMYLVYAEATLRGGTGGNNNTALQYINQLRTRAYNGSTNGNVSSITLNSILDERGRELYWEGFRRTDLIRYGLFTSGSYLWPWKGGVRDGRGVQATRNLFPIPNSDITNNPNLQQNPGY